MLFFKPTKWTLPVFPPAVQTETQQVYHSYWEPFMPFKQVQKRRKEGKVARAEQEQEKDKER